MTEDQHAAAIYTAVRALNAALEHAAKDGKITSTLDTYTLESANAMPWMAVGAVLARPIPPPEEKP